MKNVMWRCLVLSLILFATSNSLAKNTQNADAIEAFINAQSINHDFDETNSVSNMGNTDNQAVNSIETESAAMFPYVFHALLIIGLFAVLSFDTSRKAKSKRKSTHS